MSHPVTWHLSAHIVTSKLNNLLCSYHQAKAFLRLHRVWTSKGPTVWVIEGCGGTDVSCQELRVKLKGRRKCWHPNKQQQQELHQQQQQRWRQQQQCVQKDGFTLNLNIYIHDGKLNIPFQNSWQDLVNVNCARHYNKKHCQWRSSKLSRDFQTFLLPAPPTESRGISRPGRISTIPPVGFGSAAINKNVINNK